jgi:hypothetical protein
MYAFSPINLKQLEDYARSAAARGDIDPLDNLKNHKVYLFSGTLDATVKPPVVKALETMYKDFGVSSIETEFTLAAAHTFPTIDYGNPCTSSYTPYISKCNYDGAKMALQTFYGDLKPPVAPIQSNIESLDQGRFTEGRSPAALSLANQAYLYVPTACKSGSAECSLHVAFHGCQQYIGLIGMKYVENTGYNGLAEANNIVILYPQTIASQLSPSNPNGCWDWWGYLGSNYALKTGAQTKFIKEMIDYVVNNY